MNGWAKSWKGPRFWETQVHDMYTHEGWMKISLDVDSIGCLAFWMIYHETRLGQ